jgi:hypothetical protein
VQARRIIEERDHIARAADAAMRRVEADAALWRGAKRRQDSAITPGPIAVVGVGGHVVDVVEANGREVVSMQLRGNRVRPGERAVPPCNPTSPPRPCGWSSDSIGHVPPFRRVMRR